MANQDIWIIIVHNNQNKELEDLLRGHWDVIIVIKKDIYQEIVQIKMGRVGKDQTNEAKQVWLN